MKLTRHHTAKDFDKYASPFLLKREAEHNLILGLTDRAIRNPKHFDPPPYFATVVDDDEIVTVTMRTPPLNVLLSHIAPEHRETVIALMIDDYQATYDDVPGVLGEKSTARYFAEQWTARTGQTIEHAMKERIYQLDEVKPVTGVSGNWRIATEADRELIKTWLVGFHKDALNTTPSPEALDREFERYVLANDREMLIWEDHGQPVSMVGVPGLSPNGARVGAVYTPPEHRRKGYASAVVATLSQRILDAGKAYCFLYTDLQNPTSNHIYQEIGYRPVIDIDMYKFV